MQKIFLAIVLFCSLAAAQDSFFGPKAHLGFGLLTSNETTVLLTVAPRYDWAVLRIEGMGSYKAYNDEWIDVRGTLSYRFFANLPYFVEAGFSVGYVYARAQNKFHETFNTANGKRYLWGYNLREYIDYSLSMSANIYGFQANVLIPVAYSHNNVKPRPLWSIGYIFER